MLIQGVDGEFKAVSQVVTLDATDATTPVVSTVEFLRVNQVILLDGENAGNITVTRGASTLGYIGIGEGISQACQYTVPEGYSLYIFRITLNSATANGNKYIRFRNVTQNKDGRVIRIARATTSVHLRFSTIARYHSESTNALISNLRLNPAQAITKSPSLSNAYYSRTHGGVTNAIKERIRKEDHLFECQKRDEIR